MMTRRLCLQALIGFALCYARSPAASAGTALTAPVRAVAASCQNLYSRVVNSTADFGLGLGKESAQAGRAIWQKIKVAARETRDTHGKALALYRDVTPESFQDPFRTQRLHGLFTQVDRHTPKFKDAKLRAVVQAPIKAATKMFSFKNKAYELTPGELMNRVHYSAGMKLLGRRVAPSYGFNIVAALVGATAASAVTLAPFYVALYGGRKIYDDLQMNWDVDHDYRMEFFKDQLEQKHVTRAQARALAREAYGQLKDFIENVQPHLPNDMEDRTDELLQHPLFADITQVMVNGLPDNPGLERGPHAPRSFVDITEKQLEHMANFRELSILEMQSVQTLLDGGKEAETLKKNSNFAGEVARLVMQDDYYQKLDGLRRTGKISGSQMKYLMMMNIDWDEREVMYKLMDTKMLNLSGHGGKYITVESKQREAFARLKLNPDLLGPETGVDD